LRLEASPKRQSGGSNQKPKHPTRTDSGELAFGFS
jgi:hypothetical protein